MLVDMRKVKIAENLRKGMISLLRQMKHPTVQFSVTCYKNGRENGYTIRKYGMEGDINTAVTFSKARSSDKIVVYFDSSVHSDCVSDEAYKKAQYLDHSNPDRIIEMCVGHLVKDI